MKSRKFRKMNKNKSRKNRVTHKRKNHKKINRTRKGGMPKQNRESTAESRRLRPYPNTRSRAQSTFNAPINNSNSSSNSIQLVNPDNTSSHAATGVSNWFDFLLDDIPKEVVTTAMAACTTPTVTHNISNCTTPIGDKYMTMNKTPDTKDVIVGTSLVNFGDIIASYLNKKIPKISIKTRNRLRNNSDANEIFTSSVTKNNYYITFLRYLQYVKGFRIYNIIDGTRKNKLDDYFKSIGSLNNVDNFNRKDFFEFVKTILPKFEYDLGDKLKSLRIDYTGKTLADIAQSQTRTLGETYIPYFKDNNIYGDFCDGEKDWVFKCINNRGNNYISTYDTTKRKWSTLGKNTSPTLENKIKHINTNKSRYSLKKQPCGKCWICGENIYHYYIYWTGTSDPTQRIYLNSKCGEDEHVFPPTVGDIIGTLNMDAELTRGAIDQYGTHTLLSYGIRPSHAFCNQMKSDFLLYALLNVDSSQTSGENYIKDKWRNTINHWFEKERYHSLENIPSIFQTMPQNSVVVSDDITSEATGSSNVVPISVATSNTNSGTNTQMFPADNYYEHTIKTMNDYLNENIAPLMSKQANVGESDVGNMLKLKILIYIIQIGKNIIGEPFLKIWKKI